MRFQKVSHLNEKRATCCDFRATFEPPRFITLLFVDCISLDGQTDHRAVSIDSRSISIGCIAEENIIGKVFFRVMPFDLFGAL